MLASAPRWAKLFTWKACILLAVIMGSVVFYRPFCKWLCPLGAFYALLNKVSLFQMRVDTHKCVSCGACARACKMDVDITKTPQPRRMYPLWDVYESLPHGRHPVQVRAGRPIKHRNNKGVKP